MADTITRMAGQCAPGPARGPQRRQRAAGLVVPALASAALALAGRAVAAERFAAYSGTARDLGTGEFLYTEEHLVRYDGSRPVERVVLFLCRDGRAFGRKVLTYPVDPIAPDFVFDNALTGHREGVRREGGRELVLYQDRGASELRTTDLPRQPGLVVDIGFDEYVKRHWDELAAGESLRFDILVPKRLDYLSFRVRRLRADRIGTESVLVFRLVLSGFWGWILPGVDVYYREPDRSLLRYRGLSNVQDAAGRNHKVLLDMPPEARRTLAGAAELAGARARTLTASCE